MKKLSVIAACGLGAMTAISAGSAQAAPAPVAGNLQHSTVRYWCSNGVPNFVVAARAVHTPEKSVTATATGFAPSTVGPVTQKQAAYFFATKNMAGRTVTLKVVGNTSGSTFTTVANIPATCAGLPKVMANAVERPTMPTMPTKPSMPTRPVMPVKPKPVMPAQPVMPAKPGAGPKVQTDYVAASNESSTTALAAGALGLAAAGAGSVAFARRSSRR